MSKLLIYIKVLFCTLALLICTASCDLHSSTNGDIDGCWLLYQVDTISNNHSVFYRPKKIFWSFQGSIMQTNEQGIDQIIQYHFGITANILHVHEPYIYDRIDGDKTITEDEINILKPYGINARTEDFLIEKLEGNELLLRSNSLRLHFERY